MQSTGSVGTRNCVTCGRSIAWDANVCPYCGHDYRSQANAPVYVEKISDGMKILLYLVSFFIPIAGFIIGFIYYSKNDPELKHVGKMCVIIALIPILIVITVLILVAAGIALLGSMFP